MYKQATGIALVGPCRPVELQSCSIFISVHFRLGVITGNGSVDPIFSRLIPGADDGRVSVERSKVEGMTDLKIVRQHHAFIMNSSEVIKQVVYFLENGRFLIES